MSIMYDSGCRVQELCDLTVSDIRLQKQQATVKVTGKGNKTRIIPVMDSMAKLLKQYLKEFELMVPEKLVFAHGFSVYGLGFLYHL